jgi:thiol-disulfide isomerase/thioredoxin
VVVAAAEDAKTDAPPRAKRGGVGRVVRWFVEWGVVIAIGFAVMAGLKMWQARNLLPVGETRVPAHLELETMDGKTVTLGDLRGKTVLLHFWAPWCTACRFEIGSLNDLQGDLPDNTVIAAVALHSAPDAVLAMMEEKAIRYPVYMAGDDVGMAMKINQFPTTYAVNPEGRVTASEVGWTPEWRLRSLLAGAK